jgi:quinol monooxygenase YgiN
VRSAGTPGALQRDVVRLSVVLVASPRGTQQLVEALRSLIVTTRLQKGCLGCRVWTEQGDERSVRYTEEWATEEDLRRRVLSPRFTSLLSVMEAAQSPPSIQFDFVAATRGLDYVEAVRNRNE